MSTEFIAGRGRHKSVWKAELEQPYASACGLHSLEEQVALGTTSPEDQQGKEAAGGCREEPAFFSAGVTSRERRKGASIPLLWPVSLDQRLYVSCEKFNTS